MLMKPFRRAALALASLAAFAALAPQRARAQAVVETILQNDAPAGSLSLPAFSGSDATGVGFTYGGFTQVDITSLSYTVDPSTLDVTALDLNALQGSNPCPNGQNCSNRTLSLSPTEAVSGGTSCSVSDDTGVCTQNRGVTFIAFQGASPTPLLVPEPATFALLGVGLLGIAATRRRAA